MSKTDKSERFKGIDVQLTQGVNSRHNKLCDALAEAENLMAETAYEMTKPDLNLLRQQLDVANANFHELVAYRKMAGID